MGPQTEHFQKDEVVQKWYYCKIFLIFFKTTYTKRSSLDEVVDRSTYHLVVTWFLTILW